MGAALFAARTRDCEAVGGSTLTAEEEQLLSGAPDGWDCPVPLDSHQELPEFPTYALPGSLGEWPGSGPWRARGALTFTRADLAGVSRVARVTRVAEGGLKAS